MRNLIFHTQQQLDKCKIVYGLPQEKHTNKARPVQVMGVVVVTVLIKITK